MIPDTHVKAMVTCPLSGLCWRLNGTSVYNYIAPQKRKPYGLLLISFYLLGTPEVLTNDHLCLLHRIDIIPQIIINQLYNSLI